MKRLVAPFVTMMTAVACARGPLIMTRPANVEAGGLDCVSGMLHRLGYIIMDGERSLGFVRAQRDRPGRSPAVLVVNYIPAGTVDNARDTIQVRVARIGEHRDIGPSRDVRSDAERLLDQCGRPESSVPGAVEAVPREFS